MQYYQIGKTAVITEPESFDIEQTLECGQCFRFRRLSKPGCGWKEYAVLAFSKVLFVRQTAEKIVFYPSTMLDFKNYWSGYFDLARDYGIIKTFLSGRGKNMRQAIETAPGIRILRQDPWECLISFIISQNNNIPRIKKNIESISRAFGDPIGGGFHCFPTAERLCKASIDELLECKIGFRAKYILDAARTIARKEADLASIDKLPTDEAREALIKFSGVGPKIADCTLLFAYGRTEVFPTDVWIKRIMSQTYFSGGDASANEIRSFAAKEFGSFAGFAQQYLYAGTRQMSPV
ncbi:MAG: hypothetical protein LBU32_22640 [Clostridiales bacterium]|jgi:N-glycosylase/DNA lyase|nr:hypothetical protein [Clostridiales bacterium]